MRNFSSKCKAYYGKAKELAQQSVVPVAQITLGLGAASSAFAVDDYTSIGAAVAIGGVSAAIIGMGAIKILPNVAKWASNKLANFF